MIRIKNFKKLTGDKKKYEITFIKGGKEYKRKFGASGMSDFTIHKDTERRERYISRHKKDLRTEDPMRPGYLSMYILWNKPTLKASLADYKKRLSQYNKTGKFPKSISGSKKLKFGAIIPFNDTSLRRLSPDIQDIIQREVSASDIQKRTREFLSGKQKIMRILRTIGKRRYGISGESRFVDNLLLNYDITDDVGFKITKLAYDTLTADDFKNKSFWWQLVNDGLNQMYEIYSDSELPTGPVMTDFSNDNEWVNFENNQQLLVALVNRLGLTWDFVDLDEGIDRALDNLVSGWDTLDLNSFGKKYSNPANVVNKKLYSSIKDKIKKSIKGRRWGAYDSGRLVKEYKARGGKYSGKKGKTNLGRWYKEKWVDACAWPKIKPCGRKGKESVAYCRPSVKVDSKTPKLIQSLSKKQIKSRCDRKKKSPMKIITKFGAIPQERLDKMRNDFYKDVIRKSGDMSYKLQMVINKRCNGTFGSEKCNKIFIELIISIYFSLMKKYRQEPKNVSKMLSNVERYETDSGIKIEPTNISISKEDLVDIAIMLYQLQDHSFGMFKGANIAYLVYEYMVELKLVI